MSGGERFRWLRITEIVFRCYIYFVDIYCALEEVDGYFEV